MIKLGFSKDYMPTLEEVTKNKKISFYIIYRYTWYSTTEWYHKEYYDYKF